ncbi:hypothetical protein GOP47_0008112 [Adiantum capillus-veneris]|uniref:HR-like lesion-inducer n=1 Tax=Adiantum capillus-veneris TaxID=13818 RepID=A0A9D4UZ24_ADICA|nr:hypothetical protein GOP47_0008112 [Adiantum capillus-veneris]
MGLTSSVGRLLFSTIFILAAWHQIEDFGSDGGSAIKAMEPKLAVFKNHVSAALGVDLPKVEIKYLLMAAMALEGVGAILFFFGSSLGAYLLLIFLASVTPIMHDFYNYDLSSSDYSREFIQFLKNLSLFGSLMFYLGMKSAAYKQARRVKAKAS